MIFIPNSISYTCAQTVLGVLGAAGNHTNEILYHTIVLPVDILPILAIAFIEGHHDVHLTFLVEQQAACSQQCASKSTTL